MVTFRYLSLVLIILIFGGTVFPQAKKISRDEYLDRFLASDKKARALSYRSIKATNVYKNGKLSSTTEYIYETVPGDRSDSILTNTSDGKTERIEEIRIDRRTQYCKRDNTPWKMENYCIHLLDGFLDPILHLNDFSTRPVTTSRTVEKKMLDGKEVGYYREYIENLNYRSGPSGQKREEWASFEEEFYILNDQGLLLRWESRTGLLNPNRVDEENIETYIYDPTIKIEAPIK